MARSRDEMLTTVSADVRARVDEAMRAYDLFVAIPFSFTAVHGDEAAPAGPVAGTLYLSRLKTDNEWYLWGMEYDR